MGKKRDRWNSSSSEEDEKVLTKSTSQEIRNAHHPTSLVAPSLPLYNPLVQGCRLVYDIYERLALVSEGTYGVVWKAKDLVSSEIVALKQVKFDVNQNSDGFPVTALREINILLALSHENIVSVREMVVGNATDKVFMVMEFMEFDLKEGISRFEGALAQSELKSIVLQILSGIQHMHSKWYLHRDIKTSNVLVHRSGRIAVADFGLARRFQTPPRAMTQLVVTLWYRAPELLFGESKYGSAIDMWSIGCIFGELICKEAVLQGQGELDQIDQIFSLVGVPNEGSWPDFEKLPNAKMFRWKSREGPEFPKRFPIAAPLAANQAFLDGNGYNLLQQLLTLDPSTRITADQSLKHPYFCEGVKPTIPRFFSSS